jgi:putative DNA primase/helicase
MNPADLIERAFTDGVVVVLDGEKIALDGPEKAIEKWWPKFQQHERKVVTYLHAVDSKDAQKAHPKPKITQDAERQSKAKPKLVCMKDVAPREVSWLWENRFAAGRVTLIVGMPGCGKSFVTCDMAARVSTGKAWPDGTSCKQGDVLFITAEDDPGDTIRPRLDAHGADVSRIHLLQGKLLPNDNGEDDEVCITLQDVALIERSMLQIGNVSLIVIDPIGSFIGGGVDSHRDTEVRSVLTPIAKLAEQSGAAVVMVAHRRKSNTGSADDSALGSRAFVGLARSVWHLSKDTDDPERRLFLNGKNNLAKEQDGLAFRISDFRVDWEVNPVTVTADEQFAAERMVPDGESRSALDDAVVWLEQALSLGEMAATEIYRKAKQDRISERTLRRAADKLGVTKTRLGYQQPSRWSLNVPGQQDHTCPKNPIPVQQNILANNGELGQVWDGGAF